MVAPAPPAPGKFHTSCLGVSAHGNRKSLTMSLAPDPSDANATAAVVSSDLRASGPTLPASLSTPDDPTEASLAPKDQLESLELLERFKPLVVLLYALLVTAAIVGNVLLVGAIARVKRMRTVTNFLIGNLAASDALMCALCVPTSLAYVYDPRGWVLGRGTCLASLYLQPVTVHVSSFTLVAIALDRYSALVHPLRPRMSPRRCGLLAAALWLLGAALAAPALANTRYVRLPADDGGEAEVTLCEELWGARRERERVAHAAALVALTYALPLAVAVAAYARLGAKLRARVVPGSVTRAQAERDRRRRRKTQGLLAAVVAAFALCWLPLHAFNLARDVDLSLVAPRYFGAVQLACHWVAMSSACANPLIYAWLHGAFRAELRRLFCCCCRRRGAAKAKAQSSTASLASVAL
ncbi:prolactin-releasing peptide receptor-like isoform X1 [Lethenteron reissneri]|uniref:prolactin-releasing peptide receptor-like isoform X1 n=2 Tax=Lethenteron reissneri TaxID=7753 RepID=UPI002AB78384|nr:prolactin-releasing peptide receptor-like isoform X1 [Lethenteron reissneri]